MIYLKNSEYFYLYGEQNDYAFRAKKKGIKLIYCPNAKLWHKGSITTADGNKESLKLVFWRHSAILKNLVLHEKRRVFWKYYLVTLFSTIYNSIFSFRNKHNSRSYYIAKLRAVLHFTKWVIHKTKDNGYNPYIK